MSIDAISWKDITWKDVLEMNDTNEMYERFKSEWIAKNISDEVMTATEAMYENDEDARDMTLTEWVEESGYADGSVYESYDDFVEKDYAVWVLASEIEYYMYVRGEYEYPEKDQVIWLDKDGDSEKTEANIRDALATAPKDVLAYLEQDVITIDAKDELAAKANLLIGAIKDQYPEVAKEKAVKAVERD